MKLQQPTATLTLNPSADVSVEVDYWRPNDKMRASVSRWDPGGGGINVARVMRNLGFDSLAIHTAGGPEGSRLNHALDRIGLHHRSIEIREPTRISILIAERQTDARFTLTLPGPTISPAECAACLAAVSACGASRGTVIASGSLPPGAPHEFYAEAAKMVAEDGGRFILDASGQALLSALKRSIFLVKVNQGELAEIAGRPVEDRAAVIACGRDLLSRLPLEYLAVTLGGEGAVLISRTEAAFSAAPQIKVRSPIGAGDSFLAALVIGFFNDQPLQRALDFAVGVGTAAAAAGGARSFSQNMASDLLQSLGRDALDADLQAGKRSGLPTVRLACRGERISKPPRHAQEWRAVMKLTACFKSKRMMRASGPLFVGRAGPIQRQRLRPDPHA